MTGGLVAAALMLAACSNTAGSTTSPSASGGSTGSAALTPIAGVNDADLATTIKKATFSSTLTASDLDPITLRAFQVASVPLTADQESLYASCMKSGSCDTGHGTLTVAMVDDVANTWRSIVHGEFIAGAIGDPMIKKVTYTTANGDLNTFLANFRSAIAQKPDVIVGSFSFANDMGPVLKEASDAGIAVVTAAQPVPDADTKYMASQVLGNLCDAWKNGIKAVAAKLGKGTTYAMTTGSAGNAYAAAWQPCAKAGADAAGWVKTQDAYADGWTSQNVKKATAGIIASGKNPQVTFVDYSPEPAIQTWLDAGKTPPVFIGIGTSNYASWTTLEEAAKQGKATQLFTSQGQTWGIRVALEAGVFKKSGQTTPATVNYDVTPFDAASVASLVPPNAPPNVPAIPLLSLPDQLIAAGS
jgi:ABC-type sugar transport system substrate-binding protein